MINSVINHVYLFPPLSMVQSPCEDWKTQEAEQKRTEEKKILAYNNIQQVKIVEL